MPDDGSAEPRNAPTESVTARHREILQTAAQLICRYGYEATPMQRIAEACGLTKAGLYHHIHSKEHLLAEIMNFGMDIFEEQVLSPVLPIKDPLERLKVCMQRHVRLVTGGRAKEITVILHEHATPNGDAYRRIAERKKRYVRFLESSFEDAAAQDLTRPINPRVAAFAFLGTVNWIYKWFRPDGAISADQLSHDMQDLFFGGVERRS